MRKLPLFLLVFFLYLTGFAETEKISRNEYIEAWRNEAVYQMTMHRIPASITMAQGILESGDGNSRLAREGNNHFGIKCHSDWTGERIYEDDETKGECFRKYKNARDSYEDHSVFLQKKRYEPLFKLEADDYKAWAKGLKECGYATNPSYPQLLIRIIEEFKLDELDEQGLEFIRKGELPERAKGADVAANIPTAGKDNKRKSNRHSGEERSEINIRHNREITVNENRTKFTLAKAGDTPEQIAKDFDLHVAILRKYNDFSKDHVLSPGDVVYLQPKRSRVKESVYEVKAGDTPFAISQKTGLKLKKLCKLNGIRPGDELAQGRQLKLRK